MIRVNSLACMGATVAKDADRVLTFYGDDAWVLPPNAPSAEGKEQIAQYWLRLGNRGYVLRWHSTRIEVAKSGDLAHEMGTYEITLKDAKELPASQGKFLGVWKKQDNDNWKMVAQIFYSDGYQSTGPPEVQTTLPGSPGNRPAGEVATDGTSAQSKFAVQVSAVETRAEAEHWVEVLSSSLQRRALVVRVEFGGKTLYRVRIPVQSPGEAKNLAARLRHEFKLETWIVPLP